MTGVQTCALPIYAGTSRITRGFDALAFLRLRANGATVSEAAQAEHATPQKAGGAAWKRTERRLRALVRDGLAHHRPGTAVGVEGRYYSMDITHGHVEVTDV